MAQKDIQDIADYMKQLDESKKAEDQAYEQALKEQEEFYAEEDAELDDDEVIDPATMGFIDDADSQDESDAFYSEDEEKDTFEEDVSDCQETEVEEAEEQGSIEIEVYNEDGFGKWFVQDVMKNVPGVEAKQKKVLPNGDLLVKVSGSKTDLEKAFAFYIGKKTYAELSQDDKEDFESRLVFDDGDTLAEADYRETVAHCLDPIGVKASTANLVSKDTCQYSMIKEEKAKRQAARMFKALRENDFTELSDSDLDALDTIKDAVDNNEKMDPEHEKVWKLMLSQMGYTPEEWDKMTPEQREKEWKRHEDWDKSMISKTGFAKYHVGVDPKAGKKYRYQNQYDVVDPSAGEHVITQFNPDYSADDSMYQHPAAFKRQAKKDAAAIEQSDKEKAAKEAMKKARGKDTWDSQDFAQMTQALDGKQRKELMNQLIADIEADNKDNPRKAGEEIMFVKNLFGKKLTLRDIAKAWGKTAPGVMKFSDETIDIWKKTLREFNIKSSASFASMPKNKFDQFLAALKKNMGERRKGSIVSGK